MASANTAVMAESASQKSPFWERYLTYIRHEVLLGMGALPLVLSHLGPIFKAIGFGGWADTLVDAWAPAMHAIASWVERALLLVLPAPISKPYVPLVAVVLQLCAVVYFAFRRFGVQPYFVRAPAAFGWTQTWVNYVAHFAACGVLLMYIAAASGLPLLQLIQVPLDAGLGNSTMTISDRGLTLAVSVLASFLFLWHPGVCVRILALIIAVLAFDFVTGVLEAWPYSPKS